MISAIYPAVVVHAELRNGLYSANWDERCPSSETRELQTEITLMDVTEIESNPRSQIRLWFHQLTHFQNSLNYLKTVTRKGEKVSYRQKGNISDASYSFNFKTPCSTRHAQTRKRIMGGEYYLIHHMLCKQFLVTGFVTSIILIVAVDHHE